MALKLPMYGHQLAEARRAGKKPAHMVLIADGDYPLRAFYPQNAVLKIPAASDPKAYDWRPLLCCEVEVCTQADARRVVRWCDTLLSFVPVWLSFWFMDTGEKLTIRRVGFTRVLPALKELPPWN